MQKIFISFLAIFVLTGTSAIADNIKRVDNVYYKYQGTLNGQPDTDRLLEIEKALYGHTYAEQELLARIERLENTIYNRYYPDYTIDQRLNNLIYNYNKRNQIARTNRIKRIVNGINSTFVGVPTGFTPPINDPYYNGYGSYYYGNNGWRYYNNNIGTSSGIKILD